MTIDEQIKEIVKKEIEEEYGRFTSELWQLEKKFNLLTEFMGVEFTSSEYSLNGRINKKEKFKLENGPKI